MTTDIKKIKRRAWLSDKVLRFFMILVAIICVFPFAYMLILSFMDSNSMILTWERIKNANWHLDHYLSLFTGNGKWHLYLLHSFIISIYCVLLTLTVASMAAYAFDKLRFPGRKFLFSLYPASMMISFYAIMISVYIMCRNIGLLNTYSGVVLPMCGAYGVIMVHSFMKGIPNDLLEAAKVDGCTDVGVFIRVVLPLLKPALISLAVYTFFTSWGNLIWPMIVNTSNKITIVQALASYANTIDAVNYGHVMAASTVAFLPPFILYLVLQRQFVEGIAVSGLKG